MKIAGHTMGTPEYTLSEAAILFSKLGLDAIEIIFQEDYKCALNWKTTDEELLAYKQQFDKLSLEVSCIVSYASDYNLEDDKKRMTAIEECLRCIDIAYILGAKYIRIYGGTFLDGDMRFDEKREILVRTMRLLADKAAPFEINLVLENHFNTMTTGPQITYDIVKEINRENVGILYDQANIGFLSGEDYKKCIEIQKDKIYYVHVKDFIFKSNSREFVGGSVTHVKEEDRAVVTKIVGEGIVPWKEILQRLKEIGYSGYLSLEYERRWHPMDIPIADEGMKKSADYLRAIMDRI
ncbi:MAG: sugar phosphate isomerase/epimerase [Anaerolineaceae bacterium]|nr:MAG: sugar phosphate isomerase/epimerase [Anaerolineaceae bacterium]